MLRELGSLKKLASLRDLAESPVETRFSAELVQQWSAFVSTLARTYAIPDRISAEDLRQELLFHMWRLTRRVDPVSRPDDWVRQLRAELRNKCIDINRYYKARKRTARTGRAIQCQCCGSVSRLSECDDAACKFCGEIKRIREVETYARNVTLGDSDEQSETLTDARQAQPVQALIEDELETRVRSSISESDRRVYDLLVSPSDSFLHYLRDQGYDGDHRFAPNRYYAGFLCISERSVADAHARIRQAVSYVCRG